MTCPDENQLALLGEAALDDATRAPLEAHIDRCARCDMLVRELAGLAPAGRTEDATPSVPPRYRLLGRLGSGGMGVVWAAEDRELQRRVALKVATRPGDPALRARLLREARLIAAVKHPNVVTVHDIGEHADQLYVAMELVEGANARIWRAAAPRSDDEILAVWIAAADGLRAMHAAGIVHRDVKPENVLVADDGRVVVCDLGLAIDDAQPSLTRSGHAVGTLAYMAPEQARGGTVDPRTDQFAWCVALTEALTGRLPSAGNAARADARARVLEILARGRAVAPDDRWEDLDALLAALSIARSPRARRAPYVIGGLFVLALAGAALVHSVPGADRDEAAGDPPPAPADATEARQAVARAESRSASPDDAGLDAAIALEPPRAPLRERRSATRPGAAFVPDAGARPAVTADAGAHPVVNADVYRSFNALTAQLAKAEAAIEQLDPSCARLLAALPAVLPDHGTAIVERIAYARPRCEMVTSCATGKQRLATQLRAAGKPDEAIARELADADTQLCPIDAPGTAATREARVHHRVMMANARHLPCAAIVDAAEAAGIAPPLFGLHAAKCLARAGQCDRANGYIASDAQRAELASQFPACKW